MSPIGDSRAHDDAINISIWIGENWQYKGWTVKRTKQYTETPCLSPRSAWLNPVRDRGCREFQTNTLT